MTGDLADKDKNPIEKNDQPTDIVNIEELDSDDVPIGQRMALGIAKRLKNIKGQAIEYSSTPSKSIRKRASGSTTKRWSKVVTPASKKKPLKRKEVPYDSSEYNHDALSEEEGSLKGDGKYEEKENEDGSDASDDEYATNSDED
ncbi:hypothetical protein KIW84_076095 [Lathyrus oleraceus]|uniref:Uncharacterized protein n=1 Tax=Pisum sativum TaxID=3888 RepID=A0A9D5A2W9_PEA|nr:hypothetical protein KIW84_076095 [Pisum sativum]